MSPKSSRFWNVRATPARAILLADHPVTVVAGEGDPPRRRLVDAAEQVEQRGLAGAVGPDHPR